MECGRIDHQDLGQVQPGKKPKLHGKFGSPFSNS